MDADYTSIRKLRDDGKAMKEIAGLFGVTVTRIGQLLKPHERCAIHGVDYTTRCYRCVTKEKMDKALSRVEREGLMTEIRALKVRDRRKHIVARRELLVKKLHNRYGLSFAQIESFWTEIIRVYSISTIRNKLDRLVHSCRCSRRA